MTRLSPVKSHKKHKRHKSRERSRSPLEKYGNKKDDASDTETGQNMSLSVEDTNALRAKLGLAPLETNDTPGLVGKEGDQFTHVPAKNIRKIRESASIKERINAQKEKRQLYDKFGGETLAASDENANVQSWVEKMREKERIKKQALERAQLLSEMDEQFEVSQFVERQLMNHKGSYKSRDLSGLRIEHKAERFVEGKSVILTIKDQDVLEDSGDVLVNVNLVDDEKAELNRETLRKTAGLAGIEDNESEDVLMGMRAKGVLSKYDTEIEGVQKTHLVIGADGSYSTENERLLKQLEDELTRGRQALPETELRVASEYYTTDEIASKFKKRKRRVKTVRQTLTVDDLLQDQDEQRHIPDLGSRSSAGQQVSVKGEPQSNTDETDHKEHVPGNEIAPDLLLGDLNGHTREEDWSAIELDEPDEFRGELEKTITQIIKAKSKMIPKPEEIAHQLITRNASTDDSSSQLNSLNTQDTGNKVVFDSTEEFYKSIGIGFHESMQKNARFNQSEQEYLVMKKEKMDDYSPRTNSKFSNDMSLSDVEYNPDSDADTKDYATSSSKRWSSMGEDVKDPINTSIKSNTDPKLQSIIHGVLGDEPRLDLGVFSALKLAEKKGYIDKDKERRTGTGTMVNLMAKHFVEEEIRYDDIDAKFVKRDRYSGPLSEFKELSHYKPEVKLEYVDELGRDLNSKEAFRQLSHKFHGKGSGKNKTEKRVKKIKEEFLLKASTSSDTPLGTADKLSKKLKSMSLPYVILSGKNAAVKKLTK